jgi:UDP-N-acetylmuramoyl-tripeptide--D-alanyl-D-alanine ligase
MRLNLTLAELEKITGGVLKSNTTQKPVNFITKDTRVIEEGDVYWALKGAKYDGHDFIKEAVFKGAALVVVQNVWRRPVENLGVDTLEVRDTLLALQDLGKYQRLRYKIKTAAITGSNGKSSAKQMLAAICQKAGKTVANAGNLNNQIGVPLSLLEIMSGDVYGVFELGASKKGDIDETARIVLPDVAVLTNVSPAHLEFFGDIETIYKTKTEIINHISPGGALVYNIDNEYLARLKKDYKRRSLSYGFSKNADLVIVENGDNFSFTYGGVKYSAPVNVARHNKLNAAAAAGAALMLGIAKKEIEAGLASYAPMPLRLQEEIKNKTKFILDYYNANPASMENALDILAKSQGPRTAVLGDMGELGKYSEFYHGELAKAILKRDIKNILLAGKEMGCAYAVLAKAPGVMVKYCVDKKDLLPFVKEAASGGGTMLIKASRFMGFEDIYKEI